MNLDFIECGNIDALHVIFDGFQLLGELINGHLVVLNHARDLQFQDAICDRHQFSSSPQKTVLNNLSDLSFEQLHVGFIVPGLNVQDDVRLGNNCGLCKSTMNK